MPWSLDYSTHDPDIGFSHHDQNFRRIAAGSVAESFANASQNISAGYGGCEPSIFDE